MVVAGQNPNAPAVLYLHGTRWSLTGQVYRLEQLRDFGFSVLAIDYRGFGKSDGDVPSEKPSTKMRMRRGTGWSRGNRTRRDASSTDIRSAVR